MAYIGNFNANDIEPADFSALPSGIYTALISNSEFRNTKSGDGQFLVLAFQIVDGPKKGRLLWHNLNLINSNSKAVEIAQRELSAICRACGVMQIDNSDRLHNLPMRITVEFIPAGPDRKGVHREESNRIKKWEGMNGATPSVAAAHTTPAPAAKATPAPRAPAPAAAPWRPAPTPAAPAPVLETAGGDDGIDADIPF